MYCEEYRKAIRESYEQHNSYTIVAKIFNKSVGTIHYIVNNDYSKAKKTRGRKKKINGKEESKIKRVVRAMNMSGAKVTAAKVLEETGIDVSKRTMERELKRLGFVYRPIKQKITLKAIHKKNRLFFCEKWLATSLDWSKVVFSDEKKFSFDGPDNWCSYTEEVSKINRKKRQQGGGSIMVWGCVLPDGFIYLLQTIGRQKSSNYCDLMENFVAPFLNNKFEGQNYYFQQDNCSIHVSKKSIPRLKNLFPNILEWPSRSPDLNIMENVWKMISDHVYDKKQYDRADELWRAVQNAAEYLMENNREKIRNLFITMNKRCIEVIKHKGNMTKY